MLCPPTYVETITNDSLPVWNGADRWKTQAILFVGGGYVKAIGGYDFKKKWVCRIPVCLSYCRTSAIMGHIWEANKAEVDALKRENERLKELVAQLSVENLVLKKSLG